MGSSSTLTVTVGNTGTAQLVVSGVELGEGTSTDFSLPSPSPVIMFPRGESLLVDVAYRPSDALSDSGILRITSDDFDEPEVTVSLTSLVADAPPEFTLAAMGGTG